MRQPPASFATLPCPGPEILPAPAASYIVDHVIPLACGARDDPSTCNCRRRRTQRPRTAQNAPDGANDSFPDRARQHQVWLPKCIDTAMAHQPFDDYERAVADLRTAGEALRSDPPDVQAAYDRFMEAADRCRMTRLALRVLTHGTPTQIVPDAAGAANDRRV